MHCCSLSHLPESSLRASARAVHADERTHMAVGIAHIGEVEARTYHKTWGYSSISAYCVDELQISKDVAYDRIRVARTARKYPILFELLIQGRLHIGSVLLLAPRLSPQNADRLLGIAAGKSKSQIEELLAQWFPKFDVPTRLEALDSYANAKKVLVPGPVVPSSDNHQGATFELVPGPIESAKHARVTPLSADRFALELTIEGSTRDKLRRLQDLLGHQVPTGDLAKILDRALEIAIAALEKRKFGATDRPRAGRVSKSRRYIPAHVRRAVRERDGDRCTFQAEDGRRCDATGHLEFDHVVPIAQGGETTVANVRLLCRAHNQHMADRAYGSEFMQNKRDEAAATRARLVQERRTAEAQAAEAARIAEENRAAAEARLAEAACITEENRAAAEARAAEVARFAAETRAADEARARVQRDTASIATGLHRLGYRKEKRARPRRSPRTFPTPRSRSAFARR